MKRSTILFTLIGILAFLCPMLYAQNAGSPFYDYKSENPGTVHKITVNDLAPPNATKSANNFAQPSPRPADAFPKSVPGFKVDLFATGFDEPRELRTAPNGDVFLAESDKGEI